MGSVALAPHFFRPQHLRFRWVALVLRSTCVYAQPRGCRRISGLAAIEDWKRVARRYSPREPQQYHVVLL